MISLSSRAAPAMASHVLRRAAEIQASNGRNIGDYVDLAQARLGIPRHLCRVDALAAINLACGARPDDEWDDQASEAVRAAEAAARYLARHLGGFAGEPGETPRQAVIAWLADWHDGEQSGDDQPAKEVPSDADVLAALNDAADAFDAESRRRLLAVSR